MSSLDHPAYDGRHEANRARIAHAADTYIGSMMEVADSEQWIATAQLDDEQTLTVLDWYRESPEHFTAIDDIAAGDRHVA